ncbi:MAG TPA: hypothetical protein VGI24_06390 [Solirubrobacteraceae bacterium]
MWQQLGRDGGREVEPPARLVVVDHHVEGTEDVRKLLVGSGFEGFPQVGYGIEHGGDFVGVVPGGSLRLESVDRGGDAALSGAEFFDAFGGEHDDGVRWVLVLL